jgi:hypothetical protein
VAESLRSEEVEGRKPYEIFKNPYERMHYMHLTDDLIVTLDGTAEGEPAPYDAVVYLDSSARPVSWMVRGMWDFAAHKDEQGHPVPQPETFFVNIDARRTSSRIDDEGTAKLHDTFPQLANWDETETDSPRRVLVVDEIAVSGDTLDVAVNHLQAAFPHLEFKGYAWKDERAVPEFRRDNVRWYERNNHRWRAVLDPTELTDEQRDQLAERNVTSFERWLATPNPDREGVLQLRAEVDRMVQEVTSGEMPYWPSMHRSDESFDDLIQQHNDNLTPLQFRQFREWMKRYYAPTSYANLITTDANGPLTEKEARIYLSKTHDE